MKRRQRIGLSRKRAKLKREAIRTARSAVGLTPVGPALTIYDTANRASKLAGAGREYGKELIKETKRRYNRIVNPFL